MFHIVDVDNTLVFTDELNTAGYVHALACMALEPHKVVPRITREIVQEWYPQLSEYDLVHYRYPKTIICRKPLRYVSIEFLCSSCAQHIWQRAMCLMDSG
ncbi:MAG: hypothetical protein ACLTK1_00280 [Veillonella parvula]